MQLISVRSNQTFVVDYPTSKLIPNTELILLIEQPLYKMKGDKIQKTAEVKELRFCTSADGIRHLIGMLEQALKVSDDYTKLSGIINNHLASKTE